MKTNTSRSIIIVNGNDEAIKFWQKIMIRIIKVTKISFRSIA